MSLATVDLTFLNESLKDFSQVKIKYLAKNRDPIVAKASIENCGDIIVFHIANSSKKISIDTNDITNMRYEEGKRKFFLWFDDGLLEMRSISKK